MKVERKRRKHGSITKVKRKWMSQGGKKGKKLTKKWAKESVRLQSTLKLNNSYYCQIWHSINTDITRSLLQWRQAGITAASDIYPTTISWRRRWHLSVLHSSGDVNECMPIFLWTEVEGIGVERHLSWLGPPSITHPYFAVESQSAVIMDLKFIRTGIYRKEKEKEILRL